MGVKRNVSAEEVGKHHPSKGTATSTVQNNCSGRIAAVVQVYWLGFSPWHVAIRKLLRHTLIFRMGGADFMVVAHGDAHVGCNAVSFDGPDLHSRLRTGNDSALGCR